MPFCGRKLSFVRAKGSSFEGNGTGHVSWKAHLLCQASPRLRRNTPCHLVSELPPQQFLPCRLLLAFKFLFRMAFFGAVLPDGLFFAGISVIKMVFCSYCFYFPLSLPLLIFFSRAEVAFFAAVWSRVSAYSTKCRRRLLISAVSLRVRLLKLQSPCEKGSAFTKSFLAPTLSNFLFSFFLEAVAA